MSVQARNNEYKYNKRTKMSSTNAMVKIIFALVKLLVTLQISFYTSYVTN